jgi:hypothetical protein
MDDAIQIEQRSISRSGLLKLGAVAALVVGARPIARAAASSSAPVTDDESGIAPAGSGPRYLRLATYVPLVGSTFLIHREGSLPLSVKLVSATELPGVGDSFSLVFRGPLHSEVSQQVSSIEHRSLGRFELFVAPVGRGVKGQDFQAVINRIAHAGGNLGSVSR